MLSSPLSIVAGAFFLRKSRGNLDLVIHNPSALAASHVTLTAASEITSAPRPPRSGNLRATS